MIKKAYFNWSGGKDSALALYHAHQLDAFQIECLFTSLNSQNQRVSMHGTQLDLLKVQAEALNLPLEILNLPGEISMEDYNVLMAEKVAMFHARGMNDCFFGDIFLEDLRTYRETQLSKSGIRAHFPIWKRDTTELLEEFWSLGFKTMIVAVDGSKLDASYCGQVLDRACINSFPKEVDPCGENGEFHTFVFDGPIFKYPVTFMKGPVVEKTYRLRRDSPEEVVYYFQELDVK